MLRLCAVIIRNRTHHIVRIPVITRPAVGRGIEGILSDGLRGRAPAPSRRPAPGEGLDIVQRIVVDGDVFRQLDAVGVAQADGEFNLFDGTAFEGVRGHGNQSARGQLDGRHLAVVRSRRGNRDILRAVRAGGGFRRVVLDIDRVALVVDIADPDRAEVDVHEAAVIRRNRGEPLEVDALRVVALEGIGPRGDGEVFRVGGGDGRRLLRGLGLVPGYDMVFDHHRLVHEFQFGLGGAEGSDFDVDDVDVVALELRVGFRLVTNGETVVVEQPVFAVGVERIGAVAVVGVVLVGD